MEISSIDSEDRNIRKITVDEETAPTDKYPTLSAEEPEENIQNHLISSSQWEDDYVLEPLNPATGKIDNDEVYLRYNRYHKSLIHDMIIRRCGPNGRNAILQAYAH